MDNRRTAKTGEEKEGIAGKEGAQAKPDADCVRISVRALVEFILRSGDIDTRTGGMPDREAMQLGSRIHRKIQAAMGETYRAEVPLSIDMPCDDFVIRIEGRADGIVDEKPGQEALIDEIKGILRPVELLAEPVDIHLAQAKCYAYIYAAQQGLEKIRIRMSYANLQMQDLSAAELRKHMRFFTYTCSLQELEEWFFSVVEEYRKWARFERNWRKVRTESIREISFPFSYREGQKKLTRDVYITILRKKQLFIQAPTGTGKTISCVFPAVKAMGEGLAERIFYLTAKTITRTAASHAFDLLRGEGLRLKSIILTAKEKICPLDEMACDPEHCPYAQGHFDRVNDAVYEQITGRDAFDRESVLAAAEKHRVCPFELSLDIASWMDAVIGDYNYAFHPRSRLKRFFTEGTRGEYIFLVDEAHNLVDRGREMFSASLVKEDILALHRLVKGEHGKLARALMRVNNAMLALKKEMAQGTNAGWRILESPGSLVLHALNLYGVMDTFLQEEREHHIKQEPGREDVRSAVLDMYFTVGTFLDTAQLLDENYVVYTQSLPEGRFECALMCANPSDNLRKCFEKGRSSILFSATLLPIDYYRSMLGSAESYAVYADSCFDNSQLRVLTGTDVSTRYTRRDERAYSRIAEYILRMVNGRRGNYMVFFSSYKMLEETAAYFRLICPSDVRMLMQSSHMSEAEREAFLESFGIRDVSAEPVQTIDQGVDRDISSVVGFCVMGSIFGEGIDLRGERLIGAMIVGPGLPMVCAQQEILKGWFDAKGQDGFRLAYQCPGMNKVMQAAGRVIRTETDRGVVILLDERFGQTSYRRMFPREWGDPDRCAVTTMDAMLMSFWGGEEAPAPEPEQDS